VLTIWLARLAWTAVASIAVLPLFGRWLDPAPPPLKAPADAVGAAWLMVDMVSRLAPRAWMLPTTIALAAFTVLCTLASLALHVHGGVPWSRRWGSLWPLLALPVSLLLSVLLDNLLPEFRR